MPTDDPIPQLPPVPRPQVHPDGPPEGHPHGQPEARLLERAEGNTIDLTDGVTPRTPRRDPLIGKVLNQRYRILGLLARGGMGRVYRAEQEPLGRIVAVKVLDVGLEHDDDQEFRARFIREAETCARLTHPHTVRVFDYGETWDHVLFIAMEYLEGRNLYQALQTDAPMDPRRVIRIGRQIASSLREAHGLGLIHRDLKPSNVILTRPGGDEEFVKVVDFGLVKEIRADAELTRADALVGSPSYMSPEQIRSTMLDQRSDIYSLGVLLYACLTGSAPFTGPTSLTVLMGHLNHAPPPMASICPSMKRAPALEAVVLRCLAKAPADRYEHMEDLLHALQACEDALRSGAASVAHPTAPPSALAAPRPPADVPGPPLDSPPARGRVPVGSPSEVSLVLRRRRGPSAMLVASIGIGVLLGFLLAVGSLAWLAVGAPRPGLSDPRPGAAAAAQPPGPAAGAPPSVGAAPVGTAAGSPIAVPPAAVAIPTRSTAEASAAKLPRERRAPTRATGSGSEAPSPAGAPSPSTAAPASSAGAASPAEAASPEGPPPEPPRPDTTPPAPSGTRRPSDVRDPWGTP